MIGIGTDIIEIKRIALAIEKDTFLKNYFTKNELYRYENKKYPIKTIAGDFAAKEAVVKAFGTGFSGMSVLDIEILRDKNGKPFVKLYGRAERLADMLEIECVEISISHSDEYAVAFAVCTS